MAGRSGGRTPRGRSDGRVAGNRMGDGRARSGRTGIGHRWFGHRRPVGRSGDPGPGGHGTAVGVARWSSAAGRHRARSGYGSPGRRPRVAGRRGGSGSPARGAANVGAMGSPGATSGVRRRTEPADRVAGVRSGETGRAVVGGVAVEVGRAGGPATAHTCGTDGADHEEGDAQHDGGGHQVELRASRSPTASPTARIRRRAFPHGNSTPDPLDRTCAVRVRIGCDSDRSQRSPEVLPPGRLRRRSTWPGDGGR